MDFDFWGCMHYRREEVQVRDEGRDLEVLSVDHLDARMVLKFNIRQVN